MSLINRMLEDLDARQSQGGAARRGRLSRRGGTALPWIVAGVSLTLAVAVAAAWFMQKSPLVDQAQTNAAAGSMPATGKPDNAASAEPDEVRTDMQTSQHSANATEPQHDVSSAPEQTTPDTAADNAVAASNPQTENTPDDAAPENAIANNSGIAPADQKKSSAQATDATTPAEPSRQQTTAMENTAAANDDAGELQVSRHLPKPEDAAREQINDGLRAMRGRQYEQASTRLAAGLDVLPGNDQAREALYVAYRRQGRIAEAEGVLRDGLALADEPARFAKLLARELAARDARSEALQVLAIEIPPVTRDPEYHALRGALLQQEARYADALPVYEGLVRHYPDNSTWLAGLGMAQEQTGNLAGARNSYARALQAGALTATVQEYVQSRLAALQAATASGE